MLLSILILLFALWVIGLVLKIVFGLTFAIIGLALKIILPILTVLVLIGLIIFII